jgi:glycerate 2-kinase
VVKGGRITRRLQPAKVVHLLAKETSPYARLAGGHHFVHFYPDSSTFADAREVLNRWNAWDEVPASIREHLTKADPTEETVKPAEFEAAGARIFCLVSQELGMLPAAERRARELGYTPHRLATTMQAEASQAGLVTADIALSVARDGLPFAPPCALISGGELIVTVGRETGVGGRNQEFALAAATRIAGNERIAIGAIDSDGTDGPGGQFHTDGETIPCLGGAVVDGTTIGSARKAGIDVNEALRRHDTSAALWQLGSGALVTHSISLLDLRVTIVQPS